MKKYIIESSSCEKIFYGREDFHDGMCDENLCEWETQAEFDSLDEATAEFERKYSESEYYDNYKSITEYKLSEYDEDNEYTVIAKSKLKK